MTNNPTIDGVSRAKIHHLKVHAKPFEDLVSGRKTCDVRNCADREFHEGDHVELFLIDETGNPANKSIVRTITHIQRGYGLPDDICVLSYAGIDAPAVERQADPDCEWCGGAGHDHYGDPCTGCAQSEAAALQSTIAQLQARIAELESGRGEIAGFRYRANGDWEWMAKSPFADGRTHYKLGGEELQPLFTAPPAPVAVRLPERKPEPSCMTALDDDREAAIWNECLDATAALNGERK